MNHILLNLFQVLISVITILLFIRFFVQLADIRRFDAIAMPVYKTTAFVDVFSRIFPNLAQGRFCTSAVALLFLVKLIWLWGSGMILYQGLSHIGLFFQAGFELALSFIKACRYLIIGSIILSWVVMLTNNMHPLVAMVMQTAEPIIAPFRKISPNLGMIDISPIFAFFALYILEIIVVGLGKELMPML